MNGHVKALYLAIVALLATTVFCVTKVEQSISTVQTSRYDAAYATCLDTNSRHDKTSVFVNQKLAEQGQPKPIVKAWDRFIQDLVPKRDCSKFATRIVSK